VVQGVLGPVRARNAGTGLTSGPTMAVMSRLNDRTAPSIDGPILVVDDDAKIVRLVRMYLERDGFRVVEATDGRAALDQIKRQAPALIVLDLMLPEIDGLAVIEAVRGTSRTPIVVLSARGMTDDRITGLAAGADDYLPKPFSPAELVLRVKRVLERTGGGPSGAYATGAAGERDTLRRSELILDRDRHEVHVGDREVVLTATEFRLLAALLEADGRVLSRDQLLDVVYGEDGFEILDRTIDVHIGRLRDKLGDDPDEPRFVATVRGVGYRAAAVRKAPS
jgi:DNA-binding response OmpR family regulator